MDDLTLFRIIAITSWVFWLIVSAVVTRRYYSAWRHGQKEGIAVPFVVGTMALAVLNLAETTLTAMAVFWPDILGFYAALALLGTPALRAVAYWLAYRSITGRWT